MIKAPKGTRDILPKDTYKWRFVENAARKICGNFGFGEIRTPTFEFTELFARGVGDTTDVVEKQMYTFDDKKGRSITLKPEVTAAVVRAYLEDKLYAEVQPTKLFYISPCYRYENTQAGRYREFFQFGTEVFGAADPSMDAEVISLAVAFLKELGITELKVGLNSIGCPTCRKEYNERLKEYLRPHYDELCDTCKGRFERNPLRILDCKSPVCQEIAKGAPVLLDVICDDCRTHFERLQSYLTDMGIPYKIDTDIVRGLDYYTKTVFEIQSDTIGAKTAICGGGRYDGLVSQLGGDPTCGVGFGLGLDRLILFMENNGIQFGDEPKTELFIASMGEKAERYAQTMVYRLRCAGIRAEKDCCGRSLKAQMKYADKIGALYTVVLGENELETGRVALKDMKTGASEEISLDNLENRLKEE
jgi:histidyl-tRNA synthetase